MAEVKKIVFISDIVGENAVSFVCDRLPKLKRDYQPDLIIANVENAQNGKGINLILFSKLKNAGVEAMTSGNHIWDIRNRDILVDPNVNTILARPGNYPDTLPGTGILFFRSGDDSIAVVNIQGLTFMENIASPFEYMQNRLIEIRTRTKMIVVDFHAEASSEKIAFAHHFDGKVSAVIGTHTHVQTADERVLNGGTGFVTDAGMTGPNDSVIGMDKQQAITRFLTQVPSHYKLSKNPVELNGIYLELNKINGQCVRIERIKIL